MALPWLARFRRTPARPPAGEIAAANIGAELQPYIGELPIHPAAPAREAWTSSTEQANDLQIYRQVLRDERCAAALDQRLNAAISTPWDVEPGGEAAADREAAEDLAEQLAGIDIPRIFRQLLHGVWYGWAVGEAIWRPEKGRVALHDVIVRSPDRFWWGADGTLLLRGRETPEGTPMPGGKFVVLTRTAEHSDLPYAPGIARWCYWPVWFKRHGLKFWSVALERFGSPTAMGMYPPGATEGEKDRLLQLIRGLAVGSGFAIPEGQEVKLLETVRRSGGDFPDFMRYLDHMITTTILGQSSTTDQGQWRGTAEVQRDVRDETIAADTRLLDSALNSTIVRWLSAWNFPTAATPWLRHDAEPADDLGARAKREEIIARTTGLRPTEQHVIDVYGGEWEEAPRPDPPPDPAGDPGEEEPEEDDATLAGGADPPPAPPAGRVTPAATDLARWRRQRRTRTRSRR